MNLPLARSKLSILKVVSRGALKTIARLVSVLALAATACANPGNPNTPVDEPKDLARMNCGARIECITPDGQYAHVALRNQNDRAASVLIMDDDTISCPLREGDTTFVIALPQPCTLERFSFVNDNATVRGELRIAVANDKLPATSSQWTAVDGSVAFENKRQFRVSMLGVEAKFVRVIFHVERRPSIAGLALYNAPPPAWQEGGI
jgi:hypothetical protein